LALAFRERDVKGEIVVLVDRGTVAKADGATIEAALEQAMGRMTMKDAAGVVAEAFGLPRRDVYQLALSLKGR
jgi:16S rRNA (cytidine1402-2'-O)-methyltransferase